jgi:hypothetical protein
LVGFVALVIVPVGASAQDAGFALLIEDGWSALQSRSFGDERGMVYWGTGQKRVYTVVDGKKTSQVATADIVVWTREIPDPYFAPIRPVAGLIMLDSGNAITHLAIVDTPAGPRTTVATYYPWDLVDFTVTGTWFFSDGATIAGGTVNDLFVGGIIRVAEGAFVGAPTINLVNRFATSPSTYDPTPLTTHPDNTGVVRMGSFYGEAGVPFARTPVRTFTTSDYALMPFGSLSTHLAVFHVADDSNVVVACSVDPTPPAPQYCTVSGTGVFARLTGGAVYRADSVSVRLFLEAYMTK